MRAGHDAGTTLDEIGQRLSTLEHQAELIKTVLIVKEPNTVHAAEAFEGLRKAILSAAGERRAHLLQLTTMAVALNRATSLEDLRAQVGEWMAQAGLVAIDHLPEGSRASDLFEDLDGGTLDGADLIEVEEPAYLIRDGQTASVMRTGRARRSKSKPSRARTNREPATEVEVGADDPEKGAGE